MTSITASASKHGRPQSRASDTENWLSLTTDRKRKKIPPPKRHLRKTASLPIYSATTICQKKTDYCCSNSENVIPKNNGISQDFFTENGGGAHRSFLPLDAELLPKYPRFGMFFW